MSPLADALRAIADRTDSFADRHDLLEAADQLDQQDKP